MKYWFIAVFVLIAISTAAAQPVLSLNLPDVLATTKARLAASQQANIVVFGDSLSFRPGSYLPYFRDGMQTYYGNAGPGYQGFSFQTGGGFDPGWTRGLIDNDTPPHSALDGLWASTNQATTAFLNPQSGQIQLNYVAQPAGGSFRPFYWTPAGQVFLDNPISTNSSTTQLRTWNYTVPSNINQVWYQTAGDGTVTILGENNINNNPGVRIHRAANGGWGVNNFLQRDWTFDSQLQSLAPDLVMVWLGQNDQGYTRSTYATALRQLVARVHTDTPNARIVLIGTYNQGSAPLAGLVGAMQDVASQDGIGFLNMYDGAGTTQFFLNHGFLDDGVHFSPAGGQYLGNLLLASFLTNGANLGTASATWQSDSAGLWSNGSNWSPGMPSGAGVTVNFAGAIAAPRAITVDIPVIAGTINFNSANAYTLGGPGTINLIAQSGSAGLSVLAGSHTISAPLSLGDDTIFNVVPAASVLTVSGPLSAVGRTLAKTGAGAVQFQNVIAASLNLTAGSVFIAAKTSPNQPGGTSVVQSLSIAPGAHLDLGNNSLVLDYSGSVGNLLDDVRQHLQSGRLTSSAADGLLRLGYADNTLLGLTSFSGQAVDSTSILVKFTYSGDANLDGQVDVTDLAALATHWQSAASWIGGDFNYDGFVDISDLGLLASTWQGGAFSPLNPLLAAFGLPPLAVPEPAFVAFGPLLALLIRRCHRRLRPLAKSFPLRFPN